MVYSPANEEFKTKFGPVFTQLLLADEINRAPPKVQSALLEAMAEKQVTIGDNTHELTTPFVVLGTQNPIEQEGTYALPEAQLDRFMMKINVEYPDLKNEMKIIDLKFSESEEIPKIISSDDLIDVQDEIKKVFVDEKLKEFIVRVVHATRPGNEFFPKNLEGGHLSGCFSKSRYVDS